MNDFALSCDLVQLCTQVLNDVLLLCYLSLSANSKTGPKFKSELEFLGGCCSSHLLALPAAAGTAAASAASAADLVFASVPL